MKEGTMSAIAREASSHRDRRPRAAPAPVNPDTPALAPVTDRARWIEARVHELRRYGIFFYNLLLDRSLPDHLKEHAFGALWYLLEGGDLIPADDPDLAGLDTAGFALRGLAEIVGRAPPAALAVYEEVLHREGVPLRRILGEAYERVGPFFGAVSAIYGTRIERVRRAYKSAVETGKLVRVLKLFLDEPQDGSWSPGRLAHAERFLESFRLPSGGSRAETAQLG
jgi:hypothetical protein